MSMAKFIAGDNSDKLQQMREAVEKGFSQAGWTLIKQLTAIYHKFVKTPVLRL